MIEFKNVSKTYKNGTHALQNVNLKVEDGEFVYIMGPTGSGKSTLIKLLDGEEVPSSGNVIVNNVNVGRLRKSKVYLYRRKIGVVFQDYRLLPEKTNLSPASSPLMISRLIVFFMSSPCLLLQADSKMVSFPVR